MQEMRQQVDHQSGVVSSHRSASSRDGKSKFNLMAMVRSKPGSPQQPAAPTKAVQVSLLLNSLSPTSPINDASKRHSIYSTHLLDYDSNHTLSTNGQGSSSGSVEVESIADGSGPSPSQSSMDRYARPNFVNNGSLPSVSGPSSGLQRTNAQASLSTMNLRSPTDDSQKTVVRFVGRGGAGSRHRKTTSNNALHTVRSHSSSGSSSYSTALSMSTDISAASRILSTMDSSSPSWTLKNLAKWKRQSPAKSLEKVVTPIPHGIFPKDVNSNSLDYNDYFTSTPTSSIFPGFVDPDLNAGSVSTCAQSIDLTLPDTPIRMNSGGNMSKLARCMGDLPPDLLRDRMIQTHLEHRPTLPKISTGIRRFDPSSHLSSTSDSLTPTAHYNDWRQSNMSDVSSIAFGPPSPIDTRCHTPSSPATISLSPRDSLNASTESLDEFEASSYRLSAPTSFEGDPTSDVRGIQQWAPQELREFAPDFGMLTPPPSAASTKLHFTEQDIPPLIPIHDEIPSQSLEMDHGSKPDSSNFYINRAETPFAGYGHAHGLPAWDDMPTPQLTNAAVDEDVIILNRSTPEPTMRAWTGEWNNNMDDVIRALRML